MMNTLLHAASRVGAVTARSSRWMAGAWLGVVWMLTACGGPMAPSPQPTVLHGPPIGTEIAALDWVPGATVLPDEPSWSQRLAASWWLQVEGRLDEAIEVLFPSDPTVPPPSPELDVARLVRLSVLQEHAPSQAARVVASLPPPPLEAHPLTRLLHATLGLRAYWADAPPVTAAGAGVAPGWWVAAGPFDEVEQGQALPPDSAYRLDQVWDLPGYRVHPARVVQRAGGMQVPQGAPGVWYLEQGWDVAVGGRFLLAASGAMPFRVVVDNREVLARPLGDAWNEQMRLAVVEVPAGMHRVRIRAEVSGARALYFVAVPLDDVAQATFAPMPDIAPAGGVQQLGRQTTLGEVLQERTANGSLGTWLRADVAWLTGDADATERALPTLLAGDDAVSRYLAARGVARAFGRSAAARRDAALTALQGIDAQVWSLAGVLQATTLAEAGRVDDGYRLAQQVVDARPGLRVGRSTLASLATEQGFDAIAGTQLAALVAEDPSDCEAATAWLDDRLQRGLPVHGAVREESLRCADVALSWTARGMAAGWTAERWSQEAATLALRLPDSERAWELAIDAARATADEADDAAAVAGAQTWLWGELAGAGTRLDLALARGDTSGAQQILDEALALRPANLNLQELAAWMAAQPMLTELRRDGLEVIAAYQAEAPAYAGAVVYVLDYGVTRYFPDGSGVDIVHQIAQLRSRDALGDWGEVGVPAGAVLLTARTIKADGRVFVPEDIAGKDSISMPALEIGDFIELEYATPVVSSSATAPIARTSRFWFQVPDVVMHESTARYVWPRAWDGDVRVDLRNFTRDGVAPNGLPRSEEVREVRDEVVDVRFTLRAEPPAPMLEMAPPAEEWLPSVRIDHRVTLADRARLFTALVRRMTVDDARLREAVEAWVGNATDRREQTRRIFRAINEIPDFGGFFFQPAVWTLADGEGERLALTFAALEVAGLAPQLVFIRPLDADHTQSPVVDESPWDLTAIVVQDGRDRIWMEPEFDLYPFDWLRPGAQGQSAWIAVGQDAGSFLQTPVWPVETRRSRTTVAVQLEADGSAQIEVLEQMPVQSGASLRQWLQTMQDRRQLQQSYESMLSRTFPGLRDLQISPQNIEDPDQAPTIRYTLQMPDFAQVQPDGSLVLTRELFERPLAAAYGSRDDRAVPIFVGQAVEEEVRITYTPPSGYQLVAVPATSQAVWERGEVQRAWMRGPQEAVEVQREVRLQAGRVPVELLPSFRGWLQSFSDGAAVRLRWQVAP